MAPEDFYIEDSSGNILPDKYNINVVGGGLTILPVPPASSPQLTDTGLSLSRISMVAGGILVLGTGIYILPKRLSIGQRRD
jgi:hypothetical protein